MLKWAFESMRLVVLLSCHLTFSLQFATRPSASTQLFGLPGFVLRVVFRYEPHQSRHHWKTGTKDNAGKLCASVVHVSMQREFRWQVYPRPKTMLGNYISEVRVSGKLYSVDEPADARDKGAVQSFTLALLTYITASAGVRQR